MGFQSCVLLVLAVFRSCFLGHKLKVILNDQTKLSQFSHNI